MQVNVAFAARLRRGAPLPFSDRHLHRGRAVHPPRQPVLRHRAPAGLFGALRSVSVPLRRFQRRAVFEPQCRVAERGERGVRRAAGARRRRCCPREAGAQEDSGATERALRSIGGRLGLSNGEIHDALETERTADLERTRLYSRVFALAEKKAGHPLPRAIVPRIELHGPKISRRLTTEWYAQRVNSRFETCLKHLPEPPAAPSP